MADKEYLVWKHDLKYCGECDWNNSTLEHYENEQVYYFIMDGNWVGEVPKDGEVDEISEDLM